LRFGEGDGYDERHARKTSAIHAPRCKFVAAIKGRKSHDIVSGGLQIL
jgi:hypothetical protein